MFCVPRAIFSLAVVSKVVSSIVILYYYRIEVENSGIVTNSTVCAPKLQYLPYERHIRKFYKQQSSTDSLHYLNLLTKHPEWSGSNTRRPSVFLHSSEM